MAKIGDEQLKQLVEAALFVADGPLSKDKLQNTVLEGLGVSTQKLNKALDAIELDYRPRGIHLVQVASGYRFQSDDSLSPWLSKLWQESTPRYSRALLETLALIAYRQPVTRGEIEDVRGVTVSSNIIKTLTERDWIKVVGHREVPGRPALYATTKGFLDYFGLQSLEQLPDIEGFDGEIEDLFSMPTDEDAKQAEASISGDDPENKDSRKTAADGTPTADNVIPLRGAESQD
ncbi:Segregation and condensation protein B like protein [Saliniradius amylolyticus]|uniref:Segregation and condensation protein B like protein n=1 Tax=Saliniradius amylolyticus TaxID=2183582 RepID=A0A2S2E251_9ALTE|nr:SMC-Scp complex subunit ScpB [Saliniradius amylolyticus]AWL11726.1 Segregation and condensation protein B like protein [Saliniradius amylolyticus]